MKYRERYTGGALITIMVMVVVMSASFPVAPADSTKHRLAIIYAKGIRPYKNLRDDIVEQLSRKLEIKTFKITKNTVEMKTIASDIKNFKPAVIVSIGNVSSGYCNNLNIAPVISAYDTKLLNRQNPFGIVKYLRPETKKLVAIVDKDMAERQREFLVSLAGAYGFELNVKDIKPNFRDELFSNNDTFFISHGILIVNVNSKHKAPRGNSVIAVVDRSVETYKLLEERCLLELPKIDRIIDIGALKNSEFRKKLKNAKPSAIICIGSDSYKNCRFIQNKCRLFVALKAKPVNSSISRWGMLSGVNMFIEPAEQIESLTRLVKKAMKLAILYDPQNSEELILKILLVPQDDIEFVPLPISNPNQANAAITRAFDDYDGIWVIPDPVISTAPIQRLLLEESLKREKILITMMHPYTKAGALMSVSSIGGNARDLGRKISGLIDERLNNPDCAGRIVPSSAFISLNLRTIKKLKYTVPKSLLNRAEFVFGE